MHSGGWWAYISHDEKAGRPQVSADLLRRVWQYARPYQGQIVILLITIGIISSLSLLTPLILRDLIDVTIPSARSYPAELARIGSWWPCR